MLPRFCIFPVHTQQVLLHYCMFIPYFLEVSIGQEVIRTKVQFVLYHLMEFVKDIN